MKTKIKAITAIEDLTSYNITDLSIGQLLPAVIDEVMISIYEGYHTIFLPMTMNNLAYRIWNKKRGGVFNADALKYSRGKEHAKYIRIQGLGIAVDCIARIINEDEEERFKLLGLIDGIIKDRPYMIVRNINPGQGLSNGEEFVNDIATPHEDLAFYEEVAANMYTVGEDFEPHVGSLSLFSE